MITIDLSGKWPVSIAQYVAQGAFVLVDVHAEGTDDEKWVFLVNSATRPSGYICDHTVTYAPYSKYPISINVRTKQILGDLGELEALLKESMYMLQSQTERMMSEVMERRQAERDKRTVTLECTDCGEDYRHIADEGATPPPMQLLAVKMNWFLFDDKNHFCSDCAPKRGYDLAAGREPLYVHDCVACTFLGDFEYVPGENQANPTGNPRHTYDLYACLNSGSSINRSLIARFGDESGEYTSMAIDIFMDTFRNNADKNYCRDTHPLPFEVFKRALEEGRIDSEGATC